MTAGSIARELWWTNQELSCVDVFPWVSMLIYHLELKSRAVAGLISET
jgi:hypothetical protein